MKTYQFRMIGLSLIFSIISFLLNSSVFSIAFAGISFFISCIWWCSNYPGILLKDISEKVGEDVGMVLLVSSMLGTIAISIFATMSTTKPFLISYLNKDIWPRYEWYFFIVYIFPAILITYFLVRGILFLRKLN